MLAWGRRVLCGQWGPHLQCLAMLLATTLGMVVFLELPELSIARVRPGQIARLFQHARHPEWPTDFD
jgi:hypothetical protein